MPVLDLQTLFSIPSVEPYNGFAISPDGTQAAFAWNPTGQWELYLLPIGERSEPAGSTARQLTGGPGAKSAPRFSPGGKHLAYVVDPDGSESFHIWLCDLETSQHTHLLAPQPDSALQPNLAWSPDGRQIAFISNHTGRFSTYVLRLDPDHAGEATLADCRLVCDQGGPNWDLSWSPAGDRLAVVAESQGQDYAIYLADPAAGGPAAALTLDGELLNAREAAWAPDGRRLAFAAERNGEYWVGVFDRDSGAIVRVEAQAERGREGEVNLSPVLPGAALFAAGGEGAAPAWAPDGERLAYVLNAGPQSWLAVVELATKRHRFYQVEPGCHFRPAFTPDGQSLLFIFDSPRRPDDLWRLDLESGQFEQLTVSLPPDLTPDDFSMPTHITYPAPDGQPVPALLYAPPSLAEETVSGLPPAVIVIHGGPTWLFQFLWYPIMSHMASRGWVVLAPNYRGSSGYGRRWQLANRFEMGRLDTWDVIAGAEYLAREGLADPQRIAVTGRSHGGFLTASCLVTAPERWAGGSAVVPFLNWFTSHANSRQDLQHWDIENMGDPQTHADLWRERSPFFHLDQIQAPIQLICGANDPRCPASESLAARDALQALGKPVELLLYPDEGHAFLKTENVIDHELRRVEFLRRCLES